MAESDHPSPPSSSLEANPPLHNSPESDPPSPAVLPSHSWFSPQRSITNSLMNFLPHIPPHLYSKLDLLFFLYADQSLDTTVFEVAVMELIKDSPAALEEFKTLLPIAAYPSATFNDRVRAALYDDTNSYMMWLKELKQFKKGALSFPEFKEKVEPVFACMTDLWKEFDSNFADADGQKADTAADDVERSKQGSTSGEVSSASDREPDSQRSETGESVDHTYLLRQTMDRIMHTSLASESLLKPEMNP